MYGWGLVDCIRRQKVAADEPYKFKHEARVVNAQRSWVVQRRMNQHAGNRLECKQDAQFPDGRRKPGQVRCELCFHDGAIAVARLLEHVPHVFPGVLE